MSVGQASKLLNYFTPFSLPLYTFYKKKNNRYKIIWLSHIFIPIFALQKIDTHGH